LDLMILEVFSNLRFYDSMIRIRMNLRVIWFYAPLPHTLSKYNNQR